MGDKYLVDLTDAEQEYLFDLIKKGKTSVRKVTRAHILLQAAEEATDEEIAEALRVGVSTVPRTRQRLVEEGLPAALTERTRCGCGRKLDGKQAAFLVALACSSPPPGRDRWTMQLLADRFVEFQVVEQVSDETVRRVLKKTTSSRGKEKNGAFPVSVLRSSGTWRMGWISMPSPYDPRRPQVCFDESPVQLISETRQPLPARPGQPARYDYEYRRQGTANLFLFVQPLRGWRHVNVTARRTKGDFAVQMQELVDVHFPEADVIRLVVDNLNTHTPAALYETFRAEEARRLTRKLEFHYTPKHGSWLNMAECEFAVLTEQCLDHRLPDIATLGREIAAWQAPRNRHQTKINWGFSTTDARVKLKRLYPAVSDRAHRPETELRRAA